MTEEVNVSVAEEMVWKVVAVVARVLGAVEADVGACASLSVSLFLIEPPPPPPLPQSY